MRTNYKDDLLNTSINQNRHYAIKRTSDDSVVEEDIYFEDKTTYLQEGDQFNAEILNEICKALVVNDFTIPVASWGASTVYDDYGYEAHVTSDKFSTSFVGLSADILPADGTAVFSEDEENAKSVLNPNIEFDSTGFKIYAKDTIACPILLRIRGIA